MRLETLRVVDHAQYIDEITSTGAVQQHNSCQSEYSALRTTQQAHQVMHRAQYIDVWILSKMITLAPLNYLRKPFRYILCSVYVQYGAQDGILAAACFARAAGSRSMLPWAGTRSSTTKAEA